MEKPRDLSSHVQVSRSVFAGLELIRESGAANMLDRPMVLRLAREWGLTETAEWIEQADTGTYGQLIIQGADIMVTASTTDSIEKEPIGQDEDIDVNRLSLRTDEERANLRKLIATLGKQASLTIADTYDTELMGVMIGSPRLHEINSERTQLIRNLAEAASLSLQLDEILTEVEREIGALQDLIDPENN